MDELYQAVECDGLDFYALGLKWAYSMAKDCSLVVLHFEAYKAKEMLRYFQTDGKFVKLFACDVKVYSGYLKGIYDAIEVQKTCKLVPQNWVVHTINLNSDKLLNINGHVGISGVGQYKIVEHSDISEFAELSDSNHVYIIFCEREKIIQEKRESLALQTKPLYAFCTEKLKKKTTSKLTVSRVQLLLEKLFKLNVCESSLRIDDDWVESLVILGIGNANNDSQSSDSDDDNSDVDFEQAQTGNDQTDDDNNKTELGRIAIDELNLSVIAFNSLHRAGIKFADELQSYKASRLIKIRNVDKAVVNEIIEKSAAVGIVIENDLK